MREVMLTAMDRLAYVHRRGSARMIRAIIATYMREVLTPYLDATDMRTCCECLFKHSSKGCHAHGFAWACSDWTRSDAADHPSTSRSTRSGPSVAQRGWPHSGPQPVLRLFTQAPADRVSVHVLDLVNGRGRLNDVAVIAAAALPEAVVQFAVRLAILHPG